MIRQMNFLDLDQVVQLYKDANPFIKIKYIRDWTRKGLEKYPQLSFIYEQNGEILGAISGVYRNNKNVVINDIAVIKNKSNRNIGSKLMSHLLGVLIENKVNKVYLFVYWSNTAAIPFYYKFGFRMRKCSKTKIPGSSDEEDIIYLEKFI